MTCLDCDSDLLFVQDVLGAVPNCSLCNKQLLSCNSLCHHVFNNEKEYVENGIQNMKRRESKKAAKRG